VSRRRTPRVVRTRRASERSTRNDRRDQSKASPPRWTRWRDALVAPSPIERLEFIRITVPLAILGFLSGRLLHAVDWLTDAGYQVPDLGGHYAQPVFLEPVSATAAIFIALMTVASGLCTSAGFMTRMSSGLFATCLVYLALADRLASMTVSKLGAVLAVALFLTSCGARYSVDAYFASRRGGPSAPPRPTHVTWGQVRFFQILIVCFYGASGYAKARGDWLPLPEVTGKLFGRSDRAAPGSELLPVLWSHIHDSYQTWFTVLVGNLTPRWAWSPLQWVVLVFELFAPLWFLMARTRPYALAFGVAMHVMIGWMFGPVIWFALLMIALLLGCFAPHRWLVRALNPLSGARSEGAPQSEHTQHDRSQSEGSEAADS